MLTCAQADFGLSLYASFAEGCLGRSHVIISVMGEHAGEPPEKIFRRKMDDVVRVRLDA